MLVPSKRPMHINKRPARFPQPPAEIVVLEIKKNTLIESAETKKRVPPPEHRRAGHGLDAAVARRNMLWLALIVRGRTKNGGVLEDNASIRLDKPWRKRGSAGVVLRCLGQFVDRTGIETDVRVHEKDELSGSRLSAEVAAASIADILSKGSDGQDSFRDTDRIVAARVIDNDDISGIGQTAKTFAQNVAAVVAHDDDTDRRIFWRHLLTAWRKKVLNFLSRLPKPKAHS